MNSSDHHTHLPDSSPLADKASGGVVVKDPVCGMDVDPATAAGSFESGGRTHYFCSRHCLERFRSDPHRFEAGGSDGGQHAVGPIVLAPVLPTRRLSTGTTYTCPMHPEIVSDRPGSCPICGMALEPRAVL